MKTTLNILNTQNTLNATHKVWVFQLLLHIKDEVGFYLNFKLSVDTF